MSVILSLLLNSNQYILPWWGRWVFITKGWRSMFVC